MISPTLQPGVLPQVRHLTRQMRVSQGSESGVRFMTSLLKMRGARCRLFQNRRRDTDLPGTKP